MRATPRSVELHSTPAIASRGSSSLPPAGWHSTAPRVMPSNRYRSAAVKSASDPGLAGTGNTLGSGVASGCGARGLTSGGCDGSMEAAPHAATATAATNAAARINLDICVHLRPVLAVDERPPQIGDV